MHAVPIPDGVAEASGGRRVVIGEPDPTHTRRRRAAMVARHLSRGGGAVMAFWVSLGYVAVSALACWWWCRHAQRLDAKGMPEHADRGGHVRLLDREEVGHG